MELITRQEARSAGLIRYFTGKACVNGHVCERRVLGGSCIKCGKIAKKKYESANPEKTKNQRIKTRNKKLQHYRKVSRDHNKLTRLLNPEKDRLYRGLPEPTRPYPEDGLCECCEKEETSKTILGDVKRLALDHCHKNGEFRNWLCNRCNQGSGLFEESPYLMRKRAEQIEDFEGEFLLCY